MFIFCCCPFYISLEAEAGWTEGAGWGWVYALDQVDVTLCRIHFPSMILVHCSHLQNKFRTIIKNVPESASPHGLHGNICSLLKTHPDLLWWNICVTGSKVMVQSDLWPSRIWGSVLDKNRAKSSTHSFWASIYKNNTWSWSCELCAREQLSGRTSHDHCLTHTQYSSVRMLRLDNWKFSGVRVWMQVLVHDECELDWAACEAVSAVLWETCSRQDSDPVSVILSNKQTRGYQFNLFSFQYWSSERFSLPSARALLIHERRSCSERFGLIKM